MTKNPQGNPQALDVAKFLGWATEQKQNDSTHTVMDSLAVVCTYACDLIQDGRLTRADLEGLSIRAVRELCGALLGRLKLTASARAQRNVTGHTLAHIQRAEQITIDSAKRVAELVRRGEVAVVYIRQPLESDSYKRAR